MAVPFYHPMGKSLCWSTNSVTKQSSSGTWPAGRWLSRENQKEDTEQLPYHPITRCCSLVETRFWLISLTPQQERNCTGWNGRASPPQSNGTVTFSLMIP